MNVCIVWLRLFSVCLSPSEGTFPMTLSFLGGLFAAVWGGDPSGSSHPPPTAMLRADGSSDAAFFFLIAAGEGGGARKRRRNKRSQTAPICCGKIIMLAFTELFKPRGFESFIIL